MQTQAQATEVYRLLLVKSMMIGNGWPSRSMQNTFTTKDELGTLDENMSQEHPVS